HQGEPPSGTFTEVTAGDYYTCGMKTDGTLACWGQNSGGVATPPSGTFSEVAARSDHACGLGTDGIVKCWGSDTSGQLGGTPRFTNGPAPGATAGEAYRFPYTLKGTATTYRITGG